MAKNVDSKQFKAFAKRLEKATSKSNQQKFMEDCVRELAARLLSRVIKNTPVDTGNLRRGWTAGAENVSEKGSVVGVSGKTGYASQINVVYRNGEYRCAVFNTVDYASYVEYGTRAGKDGGWREGQFFLTISEAEVEALAPALLEKRLMQYLQEAMNG